MKSTAAVSLWMEQVGRTTPSPLPGDRDYDVAIVGAGYTGLWTAYYLKTLAPALSVCVLEADYAGFGASGRNGGWMMAALEKQASLMTGLDPARASTVRALIQGILPEVENVLTTQGIACNYHRGGGIYAAARYPEQLHIQRQELAELHAAGYCEDDYRWLEREELGARLAIRGGMGGIYTPHIARIHPARLVRGLAETVKRLGVDLYEGTRVLGLAPGALVTDSGVVSAPKRILALEGYSRSLAPVRGKVLAVQSRIIATEPLDDVQWSQIGLAQREVFCEASPLITYGQRSADNRMIFGARGTYSFGGAAVSEFNDHGRGFDQVQQLMRDCFPQLRGVAISHRWGGTLGAPRNGRPHAVYDSVSGLGTAGGYYGEGLGASNLMARTLVDLVLQRETPLTAAPWAHQRHPDLALRHWEPEPMRWLGYAATNLAKGLEERIYRRESPRWLARLVSRSSAALDNLRG